MYSGEQIRNKQRDLAQSHGHVSGLKVTDPAAVDALRSVMRRLGTTNPDEAIKEATSAFWKEDRDLA